MSFHIFKFCPFTYSNSIRLCYLYVLSHIQILYTLFKILHDIWLDDFDAMDFKLDDDFKLWLDDSKLKDPMEF